MSDVAEKVQSGEIKVDPDNPTAHLPKFPHVSEIDSAIDFDELAADEGFAKEVSLRYLPKNYPINKANYEFLSLYRLLKAKKEYTPELPMEYILYQLICETAEVLSEGTYDSDWGDDIPVSVERIPEPDRLYVIEKLEEESDGEFSGEDYIKSYEDFREYEETCFEDVDFAMLSFVDEDSLRESAFGKYMGVADRQGPGNVELTVNGRKVKAEFNIAPWDIE